MGYFGTMFGAMFGAVTLTKESHINEGKLVDLNGETVKTKNADMSVDSDGTLVMQQCEGDTCMALSDSTGALENSSSQPLAMREARVERKLTSVVPDHLLKEMRQISMTSTDGVSTLALQVLGFFRMVEPSSHCGTLVHFLTGIGQVTLDDTMLSVDSGVAKVLEERGFQLDNTTGSATHDRRLLEHGTSSSGLFTWFENYEWKCESLQKPR